MSKQSLPIMIKLLGLACFLLSGCISPVPYMHRQNTAAIERLLQQSAAINDNVAGVKKPVQGRVQKSAARSSTRLGPRKIPASILSAIMPSGGAKALKKRFSGKQFSVAVNNQPAKEFFMGLARGTNYSIMVSPGVSGQVTLNLDNVTIQDVLEATRSAYGYEYHATSYGYDVFPRRVETRLFVINRLNIHRAGKSSVRLNHSNQLSSAGQTNAKASKSDSDSQVDTVISSDFWANLNKSIHLIIGSEAKQDVVINQESGVVLVRAYPSALREVATFLDRTQHVLQRQVIIEAKVLEVKLNKGFRAGIDWNLAKAGLRKLGVNFNPAGLGGNDGFQLATAGDFTSTISMLSQQGNISVLSSPRISTLNNQKALLKVGDDSYFPTNAGSNTTTSATGNTITSSLGLQPFFSGVALDVTPQIDQKSNVTLHIHPVVSTVIPETKTFSGVGTSTQSVAGGLGLSDNSVSLTLAKSNIRESDSIVHVRNGEVVVIAGLMQRMAKIDHSGFPYLSHASQELLSGKNDEGTVSELIILLRPIVVTDAQVWNQQINRSIGGFGRLNS
jgi:MSHA biogenesis protein MshL